jgi:hypothetical protein
MVSQKNLSHSPLIWNVAPPRRLRWLLADDLGCIANSLEEVNAARGGLEGGDGSPEMGTSGIPLSPGSPGSAVVETLQRGRRVNEVATGEDIDLVSNDLAVVTTTTGITVLSHWRH